MMNSEDPNHAMPSFALPMRVACVSAGLAIAASPLAWKIPFGPVGLDLTDLALIGTVLALFPTAILSLRTGQLWSSLRPCLPFLVVALLSAVAAGNIRSATVETVQLWLYAGAGAWAYTRLAQGGTSPFLLPGLRAALVLGVAGMTLHSMGLKAAFADFFPSSRGLACGTSLLLCLLWGCSKRGLRQGWTPDRLLCGFAALVIVASTFSDRLSNATRPDTSGGHISQAYIEGYASLGVLAKYPLLGVGPGNYQQRIGEFYQGMPKENTMVLGTQIGHGVLLASMGFLGLGAFLYWLIELARWSLHRKEDSWFWAFTAFLLFAWGFFTPLLTGQILLPLALLHGIVCSQGESQCARSDS